MEYVSRWSICKKWVEYSKSGWSIRNSGGENPMESSPPSRFYQKTAWRKHGKRGGVFQKPRWSIPKNPGGVNFRSNLSAQASWQAARHSRAAARDHERRGSARAPALQAVTPKLGIHARVPEATLNISVEGAGWSTARAVARRRAVAHAEACLSPVTTCIARRCSILKEITGKSGFGDDVT